MIITLKGADFSASNIGTLSTWRITRSLGSGAAYEGPTSVNKDAALTATVTIAEGYELGTAGVTVTMSGEVISAATVNGSIVTITIASVTGNVVIKVPTVNISTGEEEPEVPDSPITPDEPTVYTTYRTIPLIAGLKAYTKANNTFGDMTKRAVTFGNVKAGDVLSVVNPDDTFKNKFLVYKMTDKATPEFNDGVTYKETYVSDLRGSYDYPEYAFAEDCRFLSVMLDELHSDDRNFTDYKDFCLYQLGREYTIGEPTAIHAYYGTYDKTKSTFSFTNNIRAFTVLDLKAGDVVTSATSDIGFDVYKFVDKTHTYDGIVSRDESDSAAAYATTIWTSQADQRVMVIARSISNPSGKITEDLNNVFTVTFNS